MFKIIFSVILVFVGIFGTINVSAYVEQGGPFDNGIFDGLDLSFLYVKAGSEFVNNKPVNCSYKINGECEGTSSPSSLSNLLSGYEPTYTPNPWIQTPQPKCTSFFGSDFFCPTNSSDLFQNTKFDLGDIKIDNFQKQDKFPSCDVSFFGECWNNNQNISNFSVDRECLGENRIYYFSDCQKNLCDNINSKQSIITADSYNSCVVDPVRSIPNYNNSTDTWTTSFNYKPQDTNINNCYLGCNFFESTAHDYNQNTLWNLFNEFNI